MEPEATYTWARDIGDIAIYLIRRIFSYESRLTFLALQLDNFAGFLARATQLGDNWITIAKLTFCPLHSQVLDHL